MNIFFRVKKYLSYRIKAQSKYYLHSPFIYQFYLHVLDNTEDVELKKMETYRRVLRTRNCFVHIQDFGTGTHGEKSIVEIEKHVAASEKAGRLLFRLVRYFRPNNILEIGTSIGISASYMALAAPEAKITTIDGEQDLLNVAADNFKNLGIQNVETQCGNFDTLLPVVLRQYDTIDLVLFDGNHTKEATLKYFEWCIAKANMHTVFVFDDIYWSPGMFAAWETIKQHPQITITADVYQYGICFFRKEKLAKEDFVLWY